MPGRAYHDRSGFALIGVLWLVVLVSVVGLGFSLQARGVSRRIANAADFSRARAAAVGCLAHAEEVLIERLGRSQLIGLGSPALEDPWFEPRRLLDDTIQVADALCHVRLYDAGKKLHLNEVSEEELRRLMAARRIDDADADRAAQAIMDWRDLDDLRRARGAEVEEYIQAGVPMLPANGPFGSVDQLRHVLGVTDDIFERLAPSLTLHGSGRVNLATAPAEVLSALPGISRDLLALLLRARADGGTLPDIMTLTDQLDEASRAELRANLAELMSRVTTQTQEVLIISDGWSPGTAMHVRATAVATRANDAVFVVDRSIR